MRRKISAVTPHAAILICNMYVVFYLIDRVNQAMNFIDNGLTKGLLLILCAAALFNAWMLLKPTLNERRRARIQADRGGRQTTSKGARPGSASGTFAEGRRDRGGSRR